MISAITCSLGFFVQVKQPALVSTLMPHYVISLTLDIISTFILWFNFQEEVMSQINITIPVPLGSLYCCLQITRVAQTEACSPIASELHVYMYVDGSLS